MAYITLQWVFRIEIRLVFENVNMLPLAAFIVEKFAE